MPGPVSDSYEGPSDEKPVIPWRFFFWRFRTDGWPFCPKCDEDELHSPFLPAPPDYAPGTIDQYIRAGLKCYQCGYERAPEGK